ncbi:ATP phosphoribosyltransferase regulatory subunit [Piscibacillus halophilus]|uniref:ATP phosphoribosyltransferase regulatory subunit n=1 Tax=Piscibacillus halophilus TaxID=571933 RepID=A0A1H9K9X4_9BACI|nr:ATP phosphoribosyltransferase regulatory subunit [Piscibacillus halophilus]SEQ95665.1 ATP phosphoribosyltransferase regulatory subunit [Piscibacillus halophilus]
MQFGNQLPQGVADLYSNDYERKEYVIDQINQTTKLYGFKPIQTPTFEYYDLFMNMPGTMDTDQMIKLIDHDGKILVLRPDATIPIARMVANSKDPVTFEKLSYVTNIFRMQNGDSDVFSRSFTQLGVECFGQKDAFIDVEMIALAIEALKAVGLERFQIDLGQAKFYQSLMNEVDLPQHVQREILSKLEQKNEYELSLILNKYNVNERVTNVLLKLANLFGTPRTVIQQAKDLALTDEMLEAVQELEWTVNQLADLGMAPFISVDLGLVNHLNYYTGVMFQGYVHGFGRSVIQGGRYDHLTEEFGLKIDAIGFGVYIDQLMDVLKQQDVALASEELQLSIVSRNRTDAFKIAQELREEGFIVDLFSTENRPILIDLDNEKLIKGENEERFQSTKDLIDKVGRLYGKS